MGTIKAIYDDTQIFCDQTLRVLVLWKDLENINNRSINNSVKRYGKDSRENLVENSNHISLKYILAILNSNMGQYLLNEVRGIKNKDINPDYLKDIKIPTLTLSQQEPIIELVDSIIDFNHQLDKCNIPKDKKILENQIGIIDSKLNELIYELYGLTNDEIEIVENSI